MAHGSPVRVNNYPKYFVVFSEAAQANYVILARMGKDLFLSILLKLPIIPPLYSLQGDPGGKFSILGCEFRS